jgi:uncharacterized protein
MTAASGATSHPMSQFILKVHGRCDLSCAGCYVYEGADQSWRAKPKSMSAEIVRAAAIRIGEHAAAWRLPEIHVVLHGGEPLLLGAQGMRELLHTLTSTIAGLAPEVRLVLVMQTNGIRLDRAMCDVLTAYSVRVGVSLDGDRAANDRHRRFANGAGSFDQARAALALLRSAEYLHLYAGVLCTIDVRNDPELVYAALAAEAPPQIEFLLPHANWQRPPYRPEGEATPYADWLARIYARWLADGQPMRIRVFDSLRSTAGGGPGGSEQFGTDPADLLVIDTDGGWEQSDSIKTAYHGAPGTGLNVLSHSVDEVSRLAPVAARQLGVAGLSATCRSCPVVSQCGGGLYAHRYRPGNGFDNPSAYCADLRQLVEQVNIMTRRQAEDDKPIGGLLPHDLVDQLASGHGDEPTMRWLVDAEVNITRALLAVIADDAETATAWPLLTEFDAVAPEVVRDVVAHPYVRSWAVDRLRGETAAHPDRLGEIVAAVAVRAGLAVQTEVTIRRGIVHLPTVGTVYWPTGAEGPAKISVEPGRVSVAGPDRLLAFDLPAEIVPAWWRPARRIDLGEFSVLLDDADPHRDCHGWPLADRLGEDEARHWQETLHAAWQVIVAEVPGYAPGLRAGLRTVVPLQPDRTGRQRASTARQAFGSVASAPVDPAGLAVILVHEFQHGKLGALLDLVDLFDPGSQLVLPVGWRPDPRPIEGVLQGAYAHAAVADIWRVRAARDGGAARDTYQRYLDWTAAAAEALRDSGALTPLGRQFIDRLEQSLALPV